MPLFIEYKRSLSKVNNMLLDFLSTWKNAEDWGILFLRIVIGIIFLYHGRMKWNMRGMEPNEQMNAGMIKFMVFLGVMEILGSLGLFFGFLTNFAAIGLSIIMVGAIIMKRSQMKVGFAEQNNTGWEFDLMILAGTVLLVIVGGGSLALDHYVFGL